MTDAAAPPHPYSVLPFFVYNCDFVFFMLLIFVLTDASYATYSILLNLVLTVHFMIDRFKLFSGTTPPPPPAAQKLHVSYIFYVM